MEITLTSFHKFLLIILALIALMTAAYTGFCYVAPASELAAVSMRLDIKILTDKRDYIQRRIWEIEDRYKYGGMPTDISEQLRDLKIELQNIDREILTITQQDGG